MMGKPFAVGRKKNLCKYELYRLAFKMINDGLSRNCPLQSIAIEESILTDRLSSTLNVDDPKGLPFDSLGKALWAWRPKRGKPVANAALFDEEMGALYSHLDDWRRERNELLHSIAKSSQGEEPVIAEEEFMPRAMKAATEGYVLVRKVDAWTKRQIRKAAKFNIGK